MLKSGREEVKNNMTKIIIVDYTPCIVVKCAKKRKKAQKCVPVCGFVYDSDLRSEISVDCCTGKLTFRVR